MSETRNEKDLEIERDGEKGKATWEKRVNQTQKEQNRQATSTHINKLETLDKN